MSRRELISKLFFQPWKKILWGVVTAIGLYDLFVSQFVVSAIQDKYPNLAEILNMLSLPWWAWMIIWLLLIIGFMFEDAYQIIRSYNSEPVLAKLGTLRKVGITLWHEGKTLLSEESVNRWWEKHLAWREECAQTIEPIDVSLANYMRVLGTGKGQIPRQGISDEHKHKIRMQSAWNNRLDEIIARLREKNRK
jgi:hypothetical protein